MFPTVKVTASGLEASQHYFVLMDIVLAEENRYKYSGKEWTLAGKAEPQLPARSDTKIKFLFTSSNSNKIVKSNFKLLSDTARDNLKSSQR